MAFVKGLLLLSLNKRGTLNTNEESIVLAILDEIMQSVAPVSNKKVYVLSCMLTSINICELPLNGKFNESALTG